MIYLLYATALLNVLLGLLTFVTGRRSRSTLYFFLVCLGIGGWAVTNAQFQISPNAVEMYAWAVIAYVVATLMLYCITLFAHSISSVKSAPATRIITFVCVTFGLIAPLINGVVATGVDFDSKSIVGGPLLPLLFISYLVMLINTITTLRKGEIEAKGLHKIQMRYVFIGILGAVIAGVTTNLILPAFGIYAAVALGPSFTLIMLGLISYSIVRHRLFDIRVLIGRAIYYALLTTVPYVLFFVIAYLYVQLFGTVFTLPAYLLAIPVGVSYVLFFNWVNQYLRNQINSRLINPGYDPLLIIDKLSSELGVMIDLGSTSNHLIDTVAHTIRPEFNTIVLVSDNKTKRIFTDSTTRDFNSIDSLVNGFIQYFSLRGERIFIADEIEAEIEGSKDPHAGQMRQLLEFMHSFGIKVVLGLGRQALTGLYLFGAKEGDASYTTQDIEFLKSIANSGSLAIERSLLYSQVQDFANTLQKRVEEATDELVQTNTNLEQTLTQLQEVRRQERDMLDVMGHELRTPLSIVRNALLMMDREMKTGHFNQPDYEKYLSMSIESVRREITLVETLLSATKIDASRLQLYYSQVDMKDAVNDAIEGQKMAIAQKGLKLVFNPPAGEITSYADRTRSQEIVDNFLSNSVKYTNTGEIRISVWKDTANCWIQIKDTGIGISEDDLQNLGKKFFRARQYIPDLGDKETKIVRPGGTGLGLYVTFDLIRIMGGTLYINSKVGEGSAFTFSLPLFTGQAEKQVDQTFNNDTSLSRKEHVLLNQPAPQPPQA